MDNIWILGGAGRAGRAIAGALAALGLPVTLVGRNEEALRTAAASFAADAQIVTAKSLTSIADGIAQTKPRVVINTIGPFTKTAVPFVRACAPGTHYLDIGNELPQFLALFAMNEELARTSRTVVPGVGWGVLGTESVLLKLCEGQPAPKRVRVDSIAAVEAGGTLGPTLAETIVDGILYGGRRYVGGKLQPYLAGSDQEQLTLPDGTTAQTASIASGELEAAYRASKAPEVVACFAGAPSGPVRFVIPIVAGLLALPALRNFAKKRLAQVEPPPSPRKESWARACVEWADGTISTAWLQAGDGYAFLAKAAAITAQQLLEGKGRPGCFTPGALFGPELAVKAGGTFILNSESKTRAALDIHRGA